MDVKFEKRWKSFKNSLDSLAEARQRDLSDSFVLSGISAKFSITFDLSFWMEMLKIRNQLAHDYDGVIVKEYCQRIIHEYIDRLYEFRSHAAAVLMREQTASEQD